MTSEKGGRVPDEARRGASSIARRPYALEDPLGVNYDPQVYYARIMQAFDARTSQLDAPGHYTLGAGVGEDLRLALQNNGHPYSWGDGHLRALETQRAFNPSNIVQIGTGKDASLTRNILEVFSGTEDLTVVELNAQKIDGARATLMTAGFSDDRVRFEAQDAASFLFGMRGKVGLIEAQCLFQHLPDEPPLSFSGPKEQFPTFGRMVNSITDALDSSGRAVFADMSFSDWKTYVAPGFENDLEAQGKATRANAYIESATTFGWRVRRAHPWQSAEEIAQTITEQSGNRLRLLPQFSSEMRFENQGPSDHPQVVLALLPLALIDGIRGSIVAHEQALQTAQGEKREAIETVLPRLKGAEQLLFDEGKAYSQILQDPRIRSTLPTMHWLVFEKPREQLQRAA